MTILVACHTTPTTGPGGTHRTWLTLTQTPSASRRPGCSTSTPGPDDYPARIVSRIGGPVMNTPPDQAALGEPFAFEQARPVSG